VQLTRAGDDVLSRRSGETLYERIRLSETLETVHELGQIGGIERLDSDTHDRRHRVFHRDDVVAL
jgi:hypothetical protein